MFPTQFNNEVRDSVAMWFWCGSNLKACGCQWNSRQPGTLAKLHSSWMLGNVCWGGFGSQSKVNLLVAPFCLFLCCVNLNTIHTINFFFGICWFYFGVCLMLNRFGFLSEFALLVLQIPEPDWWGHGMLQLCAEVPAPGHFFLKKLVSGGQLML